MPFIVWMKHNTTDLERFSEADAHGFLSTDPSFLWHSFTISALFSSKSFTPASLCLSLFLPVCLLCFTLKNYRIVLTGTTQYEASQIGNILMLKHLMSHTCILCWLLLINAPTLPYWFWAVYLALWTCAFVLSEDTLLSSYLRSNHDMQKSNQHCSIIFFPLCL